MRKILYSTRSKLITSFLGVSFLVGVVSLFVGGQLLYKSVLSEAQIRVSLDLNAAREVYQARINLVNVSLILPRWDSDSSRRSSDAIPRNFNTDSAGCHFMPSWISQVSSRATEKSCAGSGPTPCRTKSISP